MQKAFGDMTKRFDIYYKNYINKAIQDLKTLGAEGRLKDENNNDLTIQEADIKVLKFTFGDKNEDDLEKDRMILIVKVDEASNDYRILHSKESVIEFKKEMTLGKIGITATQQAIDKWGKYFTDAKYSGSCDLRAFQGRVDTGSNLLRCDPDRPTDFDLRFDERYLDLNVKPKDEWSVSRWKDDVNFWAALEVLKSCPEVIQQVQDKINEWEASNTVAEAEIEAHDLLLQALSNKISSQEMEHLRDECKPQKGSFDQLFHFKAALEHLIKRFKIKMPFAPVIASLSFENDIFSKCEASLPSMLTIYPYVTAVEMQDIYIPFHHQVKPKILQDALFHLKSIGEIDKRTIKVDKWTYLPRYLMIYVDRWRKDSAALPMDAAGQPPHIDKSSIIIPPTMKISEDAVLNDSNLWNIMLPATRGKDKRVLEYDLNMMVSMKSDIEYQVLRRHPQSDEWWSTSGDHGDFAKQDLTNKNAIPDDTSRPVSQNAVLLMYRIREKHNDTPQTTTPPPIGPRKKPYKIRLRNPNPIKIIPNPPPFDLSSIMVMGNIGGSCWFSAAAQLLACMSEFQQIQTNLFDINNILERLTVYFIKLTIYMSDQSNLTNNPMTANTEIDSNARLTLKQCIDFALQSFPNSAVHSNNWRDPTEVLQRIFEIPQVRHLMQMKVRTHIECLDRLKLNISPHADRINFGPIFEYKMEWGYSLQACANANFSQKSRHRSEDCHPDDGQTDNAEATENWFSNGMFVFVLILDRVDNSTGALNDESTKVPRELFLNPDPDQSPLTYNKIKFDIIGSILYLGGHFTFAKYTQQTDQWIHINDLEVSPTIANETLIEKRCRFLMFKRAA